MSEREKIKATHLSIALAKHDKRGLVELYKALFPRLTKSVSEEIEAMGKMDLILRILMDAKPERIESVWSERLFASNPTVTFVHYFEPQKEGEKKKHIPLRNGLQRLRHNLGSFDALLGKGTRPTLERDPKLIKINQLETGNFLFMFGALGRLKYVPVNFTYEVFNEPVFHYCLWDNKHSTLQIRTPLFKEYYRRWFTEHLKNSPEPTFETSGVTLENFDDFVTALNGTVRTARGHSNNANDALEAKEIRSRPDLDVREVDNYQQEMAHFDVMSHGIDFEYLGKLYRVYVGFKQGTIYFKKGDVTEPLIQHIQTVISGL